MGLDLPADVTGFKGQHKGDTVWVLASGTSMDFIPKKFFHDKVCVCVNNVGITLGLPMYYTVTHYHRDAIRVAGLRPDLPVITPLLDLGRFGPEAADREPTEPNIYRIATNDQQFAAFNAERDWPTEPDTLVAGPTSLHMTMHFAHYLGAAHIVLAGADCGRLDGDSNFTGYVPGDNPFAVWEATLGPVAEQLRARGTSVHSLNPFVSLALEGRTFRGPTVTIN